MNRSRASVAAGAALSVLLVTNTSRAIDTSACVGAADAAQRLRLAGKLLSARDQLVACAQPSCPSVVRVACGQWLGDITKSIPSLVFAAKEAVDRCESDGPRRETRDLVDVDVRLDGRLLTEKLDGRAIPIDPGSHVLRFEIPGATTAPLEETILAREGEKLRAVDVTLTRNAPPPCAPSSPGPRPVAAYLAAGASLASFGAFAIFAATSHAKYHDLMRTCAPSCTPAETASFTVQQDVADVSLGVGVVAAAVATWLFLRAGSTHAVLQSTGRGAALRVSF